MDWEETTMKSSARLVAALLAASIVSGLSGCAAGIIAAGAEGIMNVGAASHPPVTDDMEGSITLPHPVSGDQFLVLVNTTAVRMGYKVVKSSAGDGFGALLMKEPSFTGANLANALKGGDWRLQIALNLRSSRTVHVHAHAWGNYDSITQGVTAKEMFEHVRKNMTAAHSS